MVKKCLAVRHVAFEDLGLLGPLIASRGYADFDGATLRFQRLHPELGEHGVEVLLDYGVPRERIVELAREHVIFRG